jgi:hypothetical protein
MSAETVERNSPTSRTSVAQERNHVTARGDDGSVIPFGASRFRLAVKAADFVDPIERFRRNERLANVALENVVDTLLRILADDAEHVRSRVTESGDGGAGDDAETIETLVVCHVYIVAETAHLVKHALRKNDSCRILTF